MKKIFILLIGSALLLSGCSLHNGLTLNLNNHNTEVILSENNFRVIESVQGESEAMFIFGIGGLSKKAMIAEARSKMLANANIVGSSKAVINETVEVTHTFFPFVRKYTVTVSGFIVEFY